MTAKHRSMNVAGRMRAASWTTLNFNFRHTFVPYIIFFIILHCAIYRSTQAHKHEQLTAKIHQNYIYKRQRLSSDCLNTPSEVAEKVCSRVALCLEKLISKVKVNFELNLVH